MAETTDEVTVRVAADTAPFEAALRDLGREADSFAGAMTRAFRDAVVRGKDFEGVLRGLALRLADIALAAALKPVEAGISTAIDALLGGLGKLLPFSDGGVLGGGRVRPFAAGGVIAAPTYFPLAGGVGLAGEAGPEAILPLARGADGSLGVRAAGGAGGVSVTFNVVAQDAASFRTSEAEVTAMLARAVQRGRRGL